MTDNEIIKALPTVAYGGHSCNKCKYKYEKGECRCGLKGCRITRNALDLINRQKAEIERLNVRKKTLTDITKNYDWKFEKAKSEAISELNARLYAYKTGIFIKGEELMIIPMSDYDEIFKEMVGDDNG